MPVRNVHRAADLLAVGAGHACSSAEISVVLMPPELMIGRVALHHREAAGK